MKKMKSFKQNKFYFLFIVLFITLIFIIPHISYSEEIEIGANDLAVGIEYEIHKPRVMVKPGNDNIENAVYDMYDAKFIYSTSIKYGGYPLINIRLDNCDEAVKRGDGVDLWGSCAPEIITAPIKTYNNDDELKLLIYALNNLHKILRDTTYLSEIGTEKVKIYRDNVQGFTEYNAYKLADIVSVYNAKMDAREELKKFKLTEKNDNVRYGYYRYNVNKIESQYSKSISADALYVYYSLKNSEIIQVNFGFQVQKMGSDNFLSIVPNNSTYTDDWKEAWKEARTSSNECVACIEENFEDGEFIPGREKYLGMMCLRHFEDKLITKLHDTAKQLKGPQRVMIKTRPVTIWENYKKKFDGNEFVKTKMEDNACRNKCKPYPWDDSELKRPDGKPYPLLTKNYELFAVISEIRAYNAYINLKVKEAIQAPDNYETPFLEAVSEIKKIQGYQ